MELEELLASRFSTLSEKGLLKELEDVGMVKDYLSGEKLMEIGQYIKAIPLVLEGSLKVLREGEDGNELLLYFLEAGDSCAMSFTCCMKDEKSSIRVIVEEDTRILFVPVKYMDEWMMKYPSWKNFVLMSYSGRFSELMNTLDAIVFHGLDDRLLKYLHDKSKATKKSQFDIKHNEIAQDLNSSREAVSRLLKKMENLGVVKLGRNKVELLDKFEQYYLN